VGGKPTHSVVDRTGQAVLNGERTGPGGASATFGFLSAPVEEPVDAVTDGSAGRDSLDEIGDMHGTALLAGDSAFAGNGSHDGGLLDGNGSFDGGLLDGNGSFDDGLLDGNGSFGGGVLDGALTQGSGSLDADMLINGTLAPPGSVLGGEHVDPRGEPSDQAARPIDVREVLSASILLPDVVRSPGAFTVQARQASAVWEASETVTELYAGYYNQLVRLALLLVHDLQTAEEVVQDAFEAMHKAWRRLRDSEKALSYLKQTVVNRSRSVLRHRKVVDLHAPKPAPDEPSAEHAVLTLLERSAVVSALRALPERQREAIVLRYYADLSEADIARAMGISRGAVKSHTARAMAALKSTLELDTR
jgi:RNA polymerase sigma-70 factor (sigma-E family)